MRARGQTMAETAVEWWRMFLQIGSTTPPSGAHYEGASRRCAGTRREPRRSDNAITASALARPPDSNPSVRVWNHVRCGSPCFGVVRLLSCD